MATASATTDGGRSPRSSFDTAMEKADALLASTESILSSAGDDSESLLNSSSSDSSGAMGKGIPKTSGVIFNLVNAVVGAGVRLGEGWIEVHRAVGRGYARCVLWNSSRQQRLRRQRSTLDVL